MPCGCADPPSLWETCSRTTSLPTPRNQYNLQQPSLLQKGHIGPARRFTDSQRDRSTMPTAATDPKPEPAPAEDHGLVLPPSPESEPTTASTLEPEPVAASVLRPELTARSPQESEQSTFGFALALPWTVIPQSSSSALFHRCPGFAEDFRASSCASALHPLATPFLQFLLCPCSLRCHPGPRLHLDPASQLLHLTLVSLSYGVTLDPRPLVYIWVSTFLSFTFVCRSLQFPAHCQLCLHLLKPPPSLLC